MLSREEKNNTVVLTVYFEGTAFEIDSKDPRKQNLKQKQLSYNLFSNNQHDGNKQLTLGFDGCGVIEGFILGGLFGVGLDGQCRTVVKKVQDLVSKGKKVIVNCYGLSRGGIAALLLAKRLSKYSIDTVETNLALIDPVPGNLPFTTKIDFLNISFAARAMDLSACKNLKRVLCLYPYESLSYFEAHAPLIPTYPKDTQVEEDVVIDCHAAAQRVESVRYRIIDFLMECGTRFNEKFSHNFIKWKKNWEEVYREETSCAGDNHQIKEGHSHRQLEIVVDPDKKFLNAHHQKISDAINFNTENCKLSLRRTPGVTSYIKRNPYLYRAVKWLALGIIIATILYFTGGLALIPFVGGYLAKMGAWSILSATPLTALSWSAALHFIIRPLVSGLSRLTYYIFRKDDPGHIPPLNIIETHQSVQAEFKKTPPITNPDINNNYTLGSSSANNTAYLGTSSSSFTTFNGSIDKPLMSTQTLSQNKNDQDKEKELRK